MKERKQTAALVAFFLLAYALSWSIGIPLALQQQGAIPELLPRWAHYLVGYGPLLSAVAVTLFMEGVPGLARLWRRRMAVRPRPFWWVMGLSPLILGGAVLVAINLLLRKHTGLDEFGRVHFLPPLGIGALALWIVTFGIGEEAGWRGFALPRLQRDRGAFASSAVLAVFWGLWHLPQFFYLFDPSIAAGWAFGLFAGTLVLTWLFNGSGGSVAVVALWHGCFNCLTASVAADPLVPAVLSTVVVFWAALVLFIGGPSRFSAQQKVIV